MKTITANDLKSRGVSVLEAALENQDEAVISVRGKPRFVVMDIEHYERLREAEIHSAWQEARAAISQGDYVEAAAEEHIARLQKALAENAL
jgi:prevent-host-death family protein